MATLVTKRKAPRRATRRALSAPRESRNHTLRTEFVKSGDLSWRQTRCRSGTRLPDGFMSAVTEAFTRPSRIWDRARNVRLLLEFFDQPETVLPTKIRHFLARFDALDKEKS